MEKFLKSSLVWGFMLILIGAILLVQNFFELQLLGLLWGFVAGVFGVGFCYLAWKQPDQWWRWLAGAGLISISLSSVLDVFLPAIAKFLNGAELLMCLSLGFLMIYLRQRINWWAVIPAGILATLSVLTIVDNIDLSVESGSIFFLGLGLTFVTVGVLPTIEQRWAFIPGGILLALGLLLALQAGIIFDLAWPVGLILGGAYLILRSLRPAPDKKREQPPEE